MSTTDYIVDIALILVIFWQVRPRELTAGAVVLPLAILVYAGFHYLHRFTVGGNDLLLMVLFTLVGVGLGAWSGLATRVWRDGDLVLARAGVLAAATWIAGMGFRFAFALYANTVGGEHAIGRFSAHHSITSGQAWTTALVLMAFAEVLARVAIMQWRRMHARDVALQAATAVQTT
jgi:hypothetical protein